MKTIIGIFDNPSEARQAVETLRDGPLMLDDVSIISRASEAAADSAEDVSAGEGAAVGAVWGGLVGLAALLIPGVGPFIAGGALFAALTGAVTGAVVGGISAALIDFSGIPEHEARGYEDEVYAGKTLVAVKARDEDAAEVHSILTNSGANRVRGDQTSAAATTSTPARVMMYDEEGQRVEQARAAGDSTYSHGIYDYPTSSTDRSGRA
jgi:YD repeat-containing protein